MNDVGGDLPRKVSTACVMDANRKIVREPKLYPNEPHRIVEFFGGGGRVSGGSEGDVERLLIHRGFLAPDRP